MLQKGDRMQPRYANFDYDKLEASQLWWIQKLGMYSKYRKRIINRYNGTSISSDIKIMFLDHHSMRIGSTIFYNLESARQEQMVALEEYPMLSGILAFGFFVRFAYKTPVYSKLYKELGYSMAMGGAVGYSYAYYYYMKYIQVVDESYEVVKQKFANNPEMLENV